MSSQLKAVAVLVLMSIQYTYGDPGVQTKLERAQELLGQLASKSATLNKKVMNAEGDVSSLKCGFTSLKDDVTVLETARSELKTVEMGPLPQQNRDSQLSDLLGTITEKKEKMNIVKEFTHPCGHGSWREVEYLDFRDIETTCPPQFASGVFNLRPHTCSNHPDLPCSQYDIPVGDREYTRVCGRIRAYQVGTPNGFGTFHDEDYGIALEYLSGASLTHGLVPDSSVHVGTHIWSFAIGVDQDGPSSLMTSRCPCDGGHPSPDFVGEDYFCEAVLVDSTGASFQLHANNPLWDGNNCGDNSQCCTRISHPYFVKQLEEPTKEDINLRLCRMVANREIEDVALELVEIYVE